MHSNSSQPLPRLWPYLLLSAALALWIDLGCNFHRYNNSDSLVTVLTSLYQWTPFFWDQNRAGMLAPLLAMPVHSPLNNLLLQAWLVLWAALTVPFLLSRYVLRNAAWPMAGMVAVAAWIGLLSFKWRFIASFREAHYAMGLVLGLASLSLLEGSTAGAARPWTRLLVAVLLMLMASWVYSPVCLILLPLVVLRYLLVGLSSEHVGEGWHRETLVALGVTVVGLASCSAHRLVVALGGKHGDPAALGLAPAADWLKAWGRLPWDTWFGVLHRGWPGYLVLAGLALYWQVRKPWRGLCLGQLRAGVVLLGAAAAYTLMIGTTMWIHINDFCPRYMLPAVYFFQAAVGVMVARPLPAAMRVRFSIAGAGVLFLIVAVQYGMPSRGRARAEIECIRVDDGASLVQRTAEILQTRATHVCGSYHDVWKFVFHTNLVLHERHEDRRVWAVTHRCLPTWRFWGQWAPEDLRVAVLRKSDSLDDPTVDGLWASFLPPLEVVERHSTLSILRARETIALDHPPSSAQEALVVTFYGGFFSPELAEVNVRHACGGHGKLNITNRGTVPLTVRLHMLVGAAGSRPCRLWLESNLFRDVVSLTPLFLSYNRVLTVPPGRHVVTLTCDGVASPKSMPNMPIVVLLPEVLLVDETPSGRSVVQ